MTGRGCRRRSNSWLGAPVTGAGRRGRGLAIAAAVATLHGGRLSAAPAERGARLVLELPVASA